MANANLVSRLGNTLLKPSNLPILEKLLDQHEDAAIAKADKPLIRELAEIRKQLDAVKAKKPAQPAERKPGAGA